MAAFDGNLVTTSSVSSGDINYELIPVDGNVVSPNVMYSGDIAFNNAVVSGPTYRMRAVDSSLGITVYWNSGEIDATGAEYAGPGPLTDIVISEVICP